MQNSITTQFFNLGVVLLQNIEQDQMSMLGVVAAPVLVRQPPPPTLGPIPPPPPPSSSPPFQPPSSSLAQD